MIFEVFVFLAIIITVMAGFIIKIILYSGRGDVIMVLRNLPIYRLIINLNRVRL